jgi:eukaryotic-like serine/threonine-protein kinase
MGTAMPPQSSPASAVTIPAHALAATTLEPTGLGDLPPDVLTAVAFDERYAVGSSIGEGGMGIVRSCLDRRIGREVAIKSVKPGSGSHGDVGARFLREACVQGQLEHPAVVPVYDLGRDPEGLLYFTMKRVRGMTFERIVDALRLGEEDAVRQYSRRKLLTAFASVCHAVDFAHVRGVVHRDLKPGNVMLGDFGEVYVLDWGLAKVVSVEDPRLASGPMVIPSASDPGTRTAQGATMGTPGYMAPEQVGGGPVDARADVYALGTILFELLALQPLHRHETQQAAIDSTLAGLDTRPSARAPDLDVPPELDAVCMRATALDPADRYPGVREVVDAVERYLDGDRDLERRRDLARVHAQAARVHEQDAAEGDSTGDGGARARSQALHEIGRAIALDPTNEDAVRTLMRLMTTPPSRMPHEAREAMNVDARQGVRVGARLAGIAYLTWFAYLPFMLWMGIRSWTAWTVCSGSWLVASGIAFMYARRPPRDGGRPALLTLTGALAVATTATICGPYMLVPTLAAIGAMLLHMAPARTGRVMAVVAHSLAIAVPAALQWLGVLPSTYVFQPDSITIASGMLFFPAVPTHVFMLSANIAVIATAAVMIAQFRNTLSRVEAKLHVQAWQLRQLVPEQVRPASAPPPAAVSQARLPIARG